MQNCLSFTLPPRRAFNPKRILLNGMKQLGVYDGNIYLSYRAHISDLFNEKYGKAELEKLIKLSSKADDTDNYLLDTYGCPLAAEAKAV